MASYPPKIRSHQRYSSQVPAAASAPSEPETAAHASDEQQAHVRPRRTASRRLVFAALCVTCVAIALGATVQAARRGHAARDQFANEPVADPDQLQAVLQAPHILYLETPANPNDARRVAVAALGAPETTRQLIAESCQRIAMAAGQGLCLTLGHDVSKGSAFLFDEQFNLRRTIPASGLPSRAQISSDGRYGAMTFFVFGDSYAEGGFSTRTTLVDMTSGERLADLEDFTVLRDGERIHQIDFNFWGVTFAPDSDRFYATLATGGETFLIEGSVGQKTARILRENVECPSISPDGTRLVFKKRMADGPPAIWRLHVLDLATMRETPLSETRNIDDQVAWLDERHVLYSAPAPRPELWTVSVAGSDPPRLFLTGASSPVVFH
jgi:hypothetical protein